MDQSIRLRRPDERTELFEADLASRPENSPPPAPEPNFGRRRRSSTKIVKRDGRLVRVPDGA